MRRFLQIIFLAAGLLTSARGSCQSVAEMDSRLVSLLDKVDYWWSYEEKAGEDKYDSLSKANDKVADYLKKIALSHPGTIKANLPKAGKKIYIVTSDDKKLRLFSWDTHMGGTMRLYFDFAQYQAAKGMKFQCLYCDDPENADYGAALREITTIKTKNNKTVYLVSSFSVVSTKDRGESIDAYVIQDSLRKFNIFKTKTKSFNSIGYGYDAFISSEGDKDIPSIHLSADKKKLYVPIVDGEKVTNKSLVYVFDGNNYVFDKNLK